MRSDFGYTDPAVVYNEDGTVKVLHHCHRENAAMAVILTVGDKDARRRRLADHQKRLRHCHTFFASLSKNTNNADVKAHAEAAVQSDDERLKESKKHMPSRCVVM